MDIFWSIVGSALGGFLGVILFFIVRWQMEIAKTKPRLIREYLCASELNQGQPNEFKGELMHHHGRCIIDQNELKLFNAESPVWEWTNAEVGNGKGFSIIYGPYTTDFDEPCMYSVTFVMKSIGLAQPKSKIDDIILLELDVNTSIPDYAMRPSGDFINFYYQNQFAKGYVRISDLAEKGWVDCVLRFYSDAKGIWEYRIMPYEGHKDPHNPLKEIAPDARIVFNKVIIHKIPKFQYPTV